MSPIKGKSFFIFSFYLFASYIPCHAGLLLADSEKIGHRQEWVQVPETGRSIPVDVFIPITSREAHLLPHAQFTLFVPRPDMPGGLWNISQAFNFELTGADLAAVLGRDKVRQIEEVDVTHRHGLIFLPGGNGPGFAYIPAAMELARRSGFVVFLATLPFAPGNLNGHCLRQKDSKAIVDFISSHPEYRNLGMLHGMGHSLGGQNWIARLSDAQLCGIPQETRVSDAVLLDGTWESTSLAQTSNLQAQVLIFSQQCRFSQMLLQIEIPSEPARIDLEGFLVNPITGIPPRLGSGISANHGVLFGQTCLMNEAIVNSGGPSAPEPNATICRLPEASELEERSMEVVRHYSEDFFNHFSTGKPKRWPPAEQPEEPFAHLISDAPEQSGEAGQFMNYCYNVLGNDPELRVEVDFTLPEINIPRQF